MDPRARPLMHPQGAGFTREERSLFELNGFLPYDVHSLEKQSHRAWNQLLKAGRPLTSWLAQG